MWPAMTCPSALLRVSGQAWYDSHQRCDKVCQKFEIASVEEMGNSKNKHRSKKRRFSGDQFTSPSAADIEESTNQPSAPEVSSEPTVDTSASARKLSAGMPNWILEDSSDNEHSSGSSSSNTSDEEVFSEADQQPVSSGYRLVDLEKLQAIFLAIAVCKFCKTGEVQLTESTRSGLGSTLGFSCTSCNAEAEHNLVKKQGHYFDVNRRSVLVARAIGCGHAALQTFCGIMNLPPPVA